MNRLKQAIILHELTLLRSDSLNIYCFFYDTFAGTFKWQRPRHSFSLHVLIAFWFPLAQKLSLPLSSTRSNNNYIYLLYIYLFAHRRILFLLFDFCWHCFTYKHVVDETAYQEKNLNIFLCWRWRIDIKKRRKNDASTLEMRMSERRMMPCYPLGVYFSCVVGFSFLLNF